MKTVLITGGTVRLGSAIAARLRAEGWRVITSSHRADAGADIVADLAEPMGAAKLYVAALKLLNGNPPDALVNNAALFTGDAAALAAVNLEAPKKLTMLMAGRETGLGAVVNILDSVILGSLGSMGSVPKVPEDSNDAKVPKDSNVPKVPEDSNDAKVPEDSNVPKVPEDSNDAKVPKDSNVPKVPEDFNDAKVPEDSNVPKVPKDSKRPYLSAKRELAAFTRSAAATFAATLRVNAVAPGPVLAPTGVHVKAGETLLDHRPTSDDIAAAVSYLLSAESVTGAIIPVDAGQHLLEAGA